jgi:hypothetical protein
MDPAGSLFPPVPHRRKATLHDHDQGLAHDLEALTAAMQWRRRALSSYAIYIWRSDRDGLSFMYNAGVTDGNYLRIS